MAANLLCASNHQSTLACVISCNVTVDAMRVSLVWRVVAAVAEDVDDMMCAVRNRTFFKTRRITIYNDLARQIL